MIKSRQLFKAGRSNLKLWASLMIIASMFCGIWFLNPVEINKSNQILEDEEYYERNPENATTEAIDTFNPAEELTASEYAVWKQMVLKQGSDRASLKNHGQSSSAAMRTASATQTFAGGELSGKWQQKSLIKGGAHRTKGTVMNQVTGQIYVRNEQNHLYKIDLANQKWDVVDIKNGYGNTSLVTGINLSNGTFRFLQCEGNGSVLYSDDETKTWTSATGVLTENNLQETLLVTSYSSSNRKVFLHTGNVEQNENQHTFYFSSDYGQTFTKSSLSFPRADYAVAMVRPFQQKNVYVFALEKATGTISKYRMRQNDNDFAFISNGNSTLTTDASTEILSMQGTKVGYNHHYYLSIKTNGINYLYYSNNGGNTLTQQSNLVLESIDPYNPQNLNTKNFVVLKRSTDYGVTDSGQGHTFPTGYYWDIENFHMHELDNGNVYTTISTHFGVYAYTHYDDTTTWINDLNKGGVNMMIYDADYNEQLDIQYYATQDKGSNGFKDDVNVDGNHEGYGVKSTDALQVATGNGGNSVWSWMYTRQIVRHVAETTGGGGASKSTYFGKKWSSTQLVPHPDTNIDGMVVPWETQLMFITYNPTTDKLEKNSHQEVFNVSTQSFAYSKLNTNYWYVSFRSKTEPLQYSTDGGQTFQASSYTGTYPGKSVVRASKAVAQTVYLAGLQTGGSPIFLISTDNGQTFTNHVNGLNAPVEDFDMTSDDEYIYGITTDGPVVYIKADDMWYSLMTDDVPNTNWNDVNYIESKGIARFSSYGDGLWDFFAEYPVTTPPPTPTNLALNQTVTFPNVTINKGSLSNITDGAITNANADRFVSNSGFVGSGNYVYIDLGNQVASITGYKFYFQNYNAINDYEVSYLDPNTNNWVVAHASPAGGSGVIHNAAQQTRLVDHTFSSPISTASIRVEILGAGDTKVRIQEMEVYGTVSSGSRNSLNDTDLSDYETLRLYPNPVVDVLNIVGAKDGMDVYIYDLRGSIVKRTMLKNNQVNLGDLDGGRYLLKTRLSNRAYNIIKQ